MTTSTSPPRSQASVPKFTSSAPSSSRPSLSLDIANMPALSQPTPPSNTLLITNLHDLLVFQPPALEEIRNQITAVAPLNSFSPSPRCAASYAPSTTIRKLLDGKRLLNRDVYPRIYFGEPTAILDGGRPKLLEAPQVSKMFFISPPPSPPHGWIVRNEDPPNKEVHATDLAQALSQLNTDQTQPETVDPATPVSISSDKRTPSWPASGSQQRSRSSTIIYNPEDHGDSPNLPAVMVEDMTLDPDVDMDAEMSPIEMSVNQLPPKTSRPPVELME
ncbi:Calcipressin [Penicillium cf. griseofulvum]|uniref:Calcipressin n=1 Tax=Penicillium cf. griseofulvum TaxID=2972120 RepID=A0A9W9M4P2_9EURO|nr:Calcipressin [Penicillium cf. griseofulvum]KAJ5435318.1 Calcipressin [Penicillium cf. griseofulvum]KAJ5453150.1 Calcipressin [Penicillium cf. griseofulvum]